MQTLELSLPELIFVAATRGMAGAGVGLLLCDHIKTVDQRKTVGWTLLAIGALTTVPIALTVFSRKRTALMAP
jgi:hypothetical protein